MEREKIISRLSSVKTTQLQLVRDRGYDISEEINLLNATQEDFIQLISNPKNIRSSLNHIYEHPTETFSIIQHDKEGKIEFDKEGNKKTKTIKKNILVFYLGTTKEQINKNDIVEYLAQLKLARLKSLGFFESLLILNVPLSKIANDELQEKLLNKNVRVQVFLESELTYNPTLSNETPRHVALTESEKKFKLRLKIGYGGLQIINKNDPIAKYYGWTPGTIVKIYRDDSDLHTINDESLNYRIVMD